MIYRLDAVREGLDRTPYTIKVLLESLLRNCGRGFVSEEQVRDLAGWTPRSGSAAEMPFLPARVVMQDFTGVPCVVDLAAMRDAMSALGGDPSLINPLVPADLVIDHSVQVDRFGDDGAFAANVEREYERNGERYMLLRWAQQAFRDFRTVPPGTGIVHQVNLEFLSPVVQARVVDGELTAFPDTLVGTDSHTTMINGVGVLGFGVGGIEAEAVLLGQPLSQPTPTVIGLKMIGRMGPGTTATDLVLTVTEMLRAHGVVGKFVELYGAGLSSLTPRRSRDDLEHVARVRRHGHDVPDRRRDPALHGDHRPPGRDDRPHRGLREGAGALPHATPTRTPSSTRPSSSTSPRWSRASPARAGRRTAWSWAPWRRSSARPTPTASWPTAPARTTPRWR